MKKGLLQVKENRGFSLVELIIVIAIIGILTGFIAPQFLRYLERSSVAADQQTLDAIYAAVAFATADPTVNVDPASKDVIDQMIDPMRLEEIPEDTVLYEEILNTLLWPDLSPETQRRYFQSRHTDASEIWIQYKGSFKNPVAMWISHTDSTGNKDTSEEPATYLDIEKCIGIY